MGAALDQSVIVENHSGAAGTLGTEQGARAAADGYTLALATTSTLLTNPALNPKLRYQPDKDFVPIAGLARTPFVLVTADKAGTPHSLAELKARLAGTGGAFGSSGTGTIGHLAAEYFVGDPRPILGCSPWVDLSFDLFGGVAAQAHPPGLVANDQQAVRQAGE